MLTPFSVFLGIDTSTASTNSGCVVDAGSYVLDPSVGGISMDSSDTISIKIYQQILVSTLFKSNLHHSLAVIQSRSFDDGSKCHKLCGLNLSDSVKISSKRVIQYTATTSAITSMTDVLRLIPLLLSRLLL